MAKKFKVHIEQECDGELMTDSVKIFSSEAALEKALDEAESYWEDMQGEYAKVNRKPLDKPGVCLDMEVDSEEESDEHETWTIMSIEDDERSVKGEVSNRLIEFAKATRNKVAKARKQHKKIPYLDIWADFARLVDDSKPVDLCNDLCELAEY